MSLYKNLIETICKEKGIYIPARVVEASMRLEYGTLDHLSRNVFENETLLAAEMYNDDPDEMEALAKSFGLIA